MVQFLVKRLIGLIFVVIGVTFITFIMGYFAPGDPIKALLGVHFNSVVYAQLRHTYGLDLPWYQQYWNYLTHLFQLDFGLSYKYQNRAVWDILKEGVPVSTELGLWALFLEAIIGIPLGIISAIKANTWVDTMNTTVVLILYAIPTFILAVMGQVFIVWIDHQTGAAWPVSQWGNAWQYTWSDIAYKLVPILVYAATGLGYLMRLARISMLEVLQQDYIRTARAKGMAERVVIYQHALRNALIPLVTVIGLSLGILVTGAFFIEDIYNIPGIASITLNSISDRDYPVIQATAILLAVAVVFGNLVSDVLYTFVDPRIKAE